MRSSYSPCPSALILTLLPLRQVNRPKNNLRMFLERDLNLEIKRTPSAGPGTPVREREEGRENAHRDKTRHKTTSASLKGMQWGWRELSSVRLIL